MWRCVCVCVEQFIWIAKERRVKKIDWELPCCISLQTYLWGPYPPYSYAIDELDQTPNTVI